jgi:manganese oxidase
VSKQDLAKAVGRLAMGEMEMPAPDNTLPMMTGSGPFGGIEMGGMFTVMKIRDGMARDDYRDPGPYQHPAGTVAYEVDAPSTEAPRQENKHENKHENKQDNNDGGKPPKDTKGMKPKNMEGIRGM